MHECTAHLEVGSKVILPVQSGHGLALHAVLGVALQLYVYAGTGINDALVDDGHRTHAVVNGVVAVLNQGGTSGGNNYRSARDIDRSQLYHVAVCA